MDKQELGRRTFLDLLAALGPDGIHKQVVLEEFFRLLYERERIVFPDGETAGGQGPAGRSSS